MIDFKKELEKYTPVLEVEQLEDEISECEGATADLLAIFQHLYENSPKRGQGQGD